MGYICYTYDNNITNEVEKSWVISVGKWHQIVIWTHENSWRKTEILKGLQYMTLFLVPSHQTCFSIFHIRVNISLKFDRCVLIVTSNLYKFLYFVELFWMIILKKGLFILNNFNGPFIICCIMQFHCLYWQLCLRSQIGRVLFQWP